MCSTAAATITEAAGGGNDMILMHNDGLEQNFVIPANVETVQFNGQSFTGNGAANRLIGNPGANTINGGAGNDTLARAGRRRHAGRRRRRRHAERARSPPTG